MAPVPPEGDAPGEDSAEEAELVLLLLGLLVDVDDDDPEPVSLATPSAVVTEPELDDPPDPVLPVAKESVPEIPPELPVPASFNRVAGSNTLFLLI